MSWNYRVVKHMREMGCGTMFPRRGKCKPAEALKGTECGTCDGSGYVTVRSEILR